MDARILIPQKFGAPWTRSRFFSKLGAGANKFVRLLENKNHLGFALVKVK